ncbi:MAG TPA: EamA family transporter [Caulobacteraceae bacterium]|nr:EamA family transporter [Caulobacteraceae bacterium]
MPSPALSWRHALLALAVVAVWGSNFVVIHIGLERLPPLLFAALRFTLVVFPLVFFLKRPAVPWRIMALYGLLIGAGQFGLLFVAMKSDISPGLASLVVQMQVFFTIGLAIWLTKERVRTFQWVALVVAVAGIAVIAAHTDATTTPLGLGLVLLAGLSWAGGNMAAKAAGKVDMLAFVVWASLFSFPPLFALSLALEGWPSWVEGVRSARAETWAALVWQTVGNTLFGYAVWGFLLSRYPAATVAPLSLLVPVFGMGASLMWLGEPLPGWKLAAAALVMTGLALSILWPRLAPRFSGRAVGTNPPPGAS